MGKYFKQTVFLLSCCWMTWLNINGNLISEESFFKSSFNLLNYFPDQHVKISDLKINDSYIFKSSNQINLDSALSALNGINNGKENKYRNLKESENEEKDEIHEWHIVGRKEFFSTKNNNNNNNNDMNMSSNNNKNNSIKREKENFMKGMPAPYYINNITDDMKKISFDFNNEEIETKEFIYRGTYIPRIYNNTFLLILIFSAYSLCLKIIFNGFIQGKSMAKDFIPWISNLFIFFLSLKCLLPLLPVTLSTFLCLITTYYFSTVTMKPCEKIFFLKESKIRKEPVGWVFIVCVTSLLIGNFLYHAIFNLRILTLLLPFLNKSSLFFYLFYLIVFLTLTILIFFLMTINIFPAKKTQDLVFSFLSSYLLISFYTFVHNFIILRFIGDTHIFQIEPIMFFSYKPKFIFNMQNSIALFFLFTMTCISLILPKWLKKKGILGKKSKNTEKQANTYDILLGLWT